MQHHSKGASRKSGGILAPGSGFLVQWGEPEWSEFRGEQRKSGYLVVPKNDVCVE